MFLTRDQQIACDVAREHGFNPSSTLTLMSRSRKYKGAVVSVSAIKEGERYNLRIVVSKVSGSLLGVDKLTYEFANAANNQNDCVIKNVHRLPVLIKE